MTKALLIAIAVLVSNMESAIARQIAIGGYTFETNWLYSHVFNDSGTFSVLIKTPDYSTTSKCSNTKLLWDQKKADELTRLIAHSLNNDDVLDLSALMVQARFCYDD